MLDWLHTEPEQTGKNRMMDYPTSGEQEAHDDGWDDAFAGFPIDDNPYQADPSYAKAWENGWRQYVAQFGQRFRAFGDKRIR